MITAKDKLKAIQDAGYRVYVSHRRPVVNDEGAPSVGLLTARDAKAAGWTFELSGGETTVEVHALADGETSFVAPGRSVRIAVGRADCSKTDRFNKRVGLELAIRRAIATAPELRAVMGKLAQERQG